MRTRLYTHTRANPSASLLYLYTPSLTHTQTKTIYKKPHNTGVAGAYGPVSIVKPFLLKAPGTGGATAAQPPEAEEGDEEEVCVCA